MYMAGMKGHHLLLFSSSAYILSLIILIIMVLFGKGGSILNCLTFLIILVNLLFYITILFVSYLNEFVHGV